MPKKNSPGCCGCGGGTTACANLTVHGRGCSVLGVAGLAAALTSGPTTVSGGTTNSSGIAVLPFYATGSYTLTVSDPLGRLAASVTTVTLNCPTDSSTTAALPPATAFHCVGGDCSRPLKETLFYSDRLGPVTLSWIPTLFASGGWGALVTRTLSSATPAFAPLSSCGSLGVTLAAGPVSASVAYTYDGASMRVQVYSCVVNPGLGGGTCAGVPDAPALPWATSTCGGGHIAMVSTRTLSSLVCPGAAYSAAGTFAASSVTPNTWIYGGTAVPWSISE